MVFPKMFRTFTQLKTREQFFCCG